MIEKTALFAMLRHCRDEIRERDRRIKQLQLQLQVANHIIREQSEERGPPPVGVPMEERLRRP